jgi:sugar phosphate isomerase/epimerase
MVTTPGSEVLASVGRDAAPEQPAWQRAVYDESGLLELASVLGARNLAAVHFGAARPIDVAATQSARLCDAAAERGLTVSLEYAAMATISDVATAWAIVSRSGSANGGLVHDVWHHDRSTADDADLAAVPADRILSIQLSDAAAERHGPLVEDVRHRRLLGDGDLHPGATLRALLERGVRCPVGIEVFTPFDRRPVQERVDELANSLRSALPTGG